MGRKRGLAAGIALGLSCAGVVDSASAATFTVTSADDTNDGNCNTTHCSLREAIRAANNLAGTDNIYFAIGTGHQVIRPTKALPDLKGDLVVNGATQPGFAGAPLIELDGSLAGAATAGLKVMGDRVTLKALVINRFSAEGVNILTSYNVVVGCYIGLDHTGTVGLPNHGGVSIRRSRSNLVGGPKPEDRNVISANGPVIPIDGTGSSSSANVYLETVPLWMANLTDNLVANNFIGTDVTGTKVPVPPAPDKRFGTIGVWIKGGVHNEIGGKHPGTGNVISGNSSAGISVDPASPVGPEVGTNELFIFNNFIGTDVTGKLPLPNGTIGIAITASDGVAIGLEPDRKNVIAFNGGVGIRYDKSKRGAFLYNSIHDNGGIGIDLGWDGNHTPNDDGDFDKGPNGLQNFPKLVSATQTEVRGTLDSIIAMEAPNGIPTSDGVPALYKVQIFASKSCDKSRFGEGDVFVGEKVVTVGDFKIPWKPAFFGTQFLTATATDAKGNTSEFSRCFAYP